MATEGVKISEMTELAEIKGTEYIPVVDGSENKKVLIDKFATKEDIPDGSRAVGKVDPNSDGTGEIFNLYKPTGTYGLTNKAIGKYSTSRGYGTTASGIGSYSGGYNHLETSYSNYGETIEAKGNGSHAEGCCDYYGEIIAEGDGSFAFGRLSGGTIMSKGDGSFAFGETNITNADTSKIIAEGNGSFAFGKPLYGTIMSKGDGSFAFGFAEGGGVGIDRYVNISASGKGSFAEGFATSSLVENYGSGGIYAKGDGSKAQNVNTIAEGYAQTAIGCNNAKEETPSPTSFNAEKIAFVIGNGTSDAAGNAFYVKFNGQTHADGEYSSAGADYAECFEWEDANPTNEDRVGRFVTLDGDKIRLATATDTYILGIISGAPTVVGDDPMRWQGKYLNDEWGRPIYEDVTRTYKRKKKQKDDSIVEEEVTKTTHERKINPAYDPMEKYIPRTERPEWDYVGMMGKLLVKQDGTLAAGSFCKSGANGIATKAESGYYVMKVINENQALVLFR